MVSSLVVAAAGTASASGAFASSAGSSEDYAAAGFFANIPITFVPHYLVWIFSFNVPVFDATAPPPTIAVSFTTDPKYFKFEPAN